MVMRLEDVKIDCISVGDRIRQVSDGTVAALMESMKVIGLINPIMITRPRMQPVLIAGAHRLEAARRLGWTSIKCMVSPSIEEDDAKLAEIDENLIRSELSAAERALSISMRKEIYERKHPETKPTKRGGPGRAKQTQSQLATESEPPPAFIDDTAKKTGRHRATVARDNQRAESIPQIADVINTSLDKGEELDALGKMTPEQQAEIIEKAKSGENVSAKTELKKQERTKKEADLAVKQVALPTAKYGVILADPEWRFEPYSRETGMDRAADNHYSTSATEVIAERDVPSIAAKDCVLFLWATVPMLPDALQVMQAWGFTYKSHCCWVKDKMGTGYWFRNKHELLLVGTKGNVPAPAPGTQSASVIEAPAGRHSEKPNDAYDLIESYFPNLPKIELNARSRRVGWEAWGNEAQEAA